MQADELEFKHGKVVFRNPSWREPLLAPARLDESPARGSVFMQFGNYMDGASFLCVISNMHLCAGIKMSSMYSFVEEDHEDEEVWLLSVQLYSHLISTQSVDGRRISWKGPGR